LGNSCDTELRQSASQLALGTAFVLLGQMAFVSGGYLLHFYLARAIDPIAYGTYGLIMNVLTWTESALNNGLPWAVRKYLPADPEAAGVILRTALRWQMTVGALLYVATTAAVPWFAAAIQDPSITLYLRLALADILLMSLYTLYRGALNGLRLFAAQGASMLVYALAKLGSSVLLVQVGRSLTGAIIGNAIGTLVAWLAAAWLLRRATGLSLSRTAQRSESAAALYSGRTMLSFALPTVLFTLTSTFRSTVGLVGVKALLGDGLQVAYYSAANYLAVAPTMLLFAFSFTLFPHLASSIHAENWSLTRAYMRSAVRYFAIVVIPSVLLVLGTSPQLIPLLYPDSYAAAAPLLNWLLISTALHSLYMIFANAILAEGRVLLALGISSGLVPLSFMTTWLLTGRWGATGAAVAAAATTGLATMAVSAYVLRRFAVQLPWDSLGRITIASLGIFAVTRLYVPRGALLVPYFVALGMAYLALLLVLREITAEDLGQWQADLSKVIVKWRLRTSG
jgi:O-antigen/teichoic acid export membrane protein